MKEVRCLNSIEEEIEQRLYVLNSDDNSREENKWIQCIEQLGNPNYLLKVREYLDSISLEHKGLTKNQYLAHCYRVSTLGMCFSRESTDQIGAVGLLHNILEISNVDEEEIENNFGRTFLECLTTLKVKRNQQWDPTYLKEYYQNIYLQNSFLYKVKVVDKLDNLFILGINPNADTREKYLDEINTYVLPMAEKVDLRMAEYFNKLIQFNIRTGFFKK